MTQKRGNEERARKEGRKATETMNRKTWLGKR
jgi:hypothetical protein